jgi:hypothetical protein
MAGIELMAMSRTDPKLMANTELMAVCGSTHLSKKTCGISDFRQEKKSKLRSKKREIEKKRICDKESEDEKEDEEEEEPKSNYRSEAGLDNPNMDILIIGKLLDPIVLSREIYSAGTEIDEKDDEKEEDEKEENSIDCRGHSRTCQLDALTKSIIDSIF